MIDPQATDAPAPGATYASAGVDVEAGERAVALMRAAVARAQRPEVVGGLALVAPLTHLVDDVPEIGALVERLVDYAPPQLHVVISTRQMPLLEALTAASRTAVAA